MAGAIAVGAVVFRLARGRKEALLGGAMPPPAAGGIDRRLVAGSVMFGAGWGLAGYCPGPALVSLGSGQDQGVVFVVAMLAGMGLFEIVQWRREPVRKEE
jgi:hypothetical protein